MTTLQPFSRTLTQSGGLASIRVKNAALLNLLKDKKYQMAIEHTEEYIEGLQKNQIRMNKLDEKYGRVVNDKGVQEIVQSIQKDLEEYEQTLQKLAGSNKLMRFLTQSRLRRPFDKLNVRIQTKLESLEKELEKVDKMVFGQNPRAASEIVSKSRMSVDSQDSSVRGSMSKESMNNNNWKTAKATDPETSSGPMSAKSTDPCNIACNQILHFQETLPWSEFLVRLRKFETVEIEDEEPLAMVLDNSSTGVLTRYKFREFLKGFGPLGQSVSNLKKILNEEWFHSFLTLEEARMMLANQPFGTWLMRFSSSKPGSFALDYMGRAPTAASRYCAMVSPQSSMPVDSADHNSVIIQSTGTGFQVREEEKEISFKSISEIVEHYKSVLKFPFSGTLSKQSWFYGDISSDEASQMLAKERPGTFLVRFANQQVYPGCFAVSFVSTNGVLGKSLLKKVKGGFLVDHSPDQNVYPSVPALVAAYNKKNFFLYPYAYERPENSAIGGYTQVETLEKNNQSEKDSGSFVSATGSNPTGSVTNNSTPTTDSNLGASGLGRSSTGSLGSNNGSVPPNYVNPSTLLNNSIDHKYGNTPKQPTTTSAASWDASQVAHWVSTIFPQYETAFRENAIDGVILLELNEQNLKDDLGIVALGHRKLLVKKIEELK